MGKDVSPETNRILEAVRRCSETLENLDIQEHAASIAQLQVLSMRRIEAWKAQQEELKQKAQDSLHAKSRLAV